MGVFGESRVSVAYSSLPVPRLGLHVQGFSFPTCSVKIRAVIKISEGDLAIATQAMVACGRLTRQGRRESAGKLLRELPQTGELKESQRRPRNYIGIPCGYS